MKKIKVAIIGAGNISNTRHIPALKKLRNVEIYGVVGIKTSNINRTLTRIHTKNMLHLKSSNFAEEMKKCSWFADIDAVLIGAPPRDHYSLVEASLLNGKHVLVEKPMAMDTAEADKLILLAKRMKKVLCVVHNFQYTKGVQRLGRIIDSGSLGELVSFSEFQLSNKNRRLPEWYNDLPLGLFFDEAPHFMYLLEKFGGKLKVEDAFAQVGSNASDNTPLQMSVALRAGKYPVNLYINFESPVCEWYFVVCGKNKIAIYDLFKDILVVLPSDNEHYAADVIKNSWRATWQYWVGFVVNGFRMLVGNLLYGHDVVVRNFIGSVVAGRNIDNNLSGSRGRATVQYMNDIVAMANKKRRTR
jgi:predicted dehydrogenase